MKTLRANVIRLAHQNPSMRKALLDIITACDCESEAPMVGKFEEGVPADPTENMSKEDAKEWKIQNLRNRDNFTAAQRAVPGNQQQWYTRILKMYAEHNKRIVASGLRLQKEDMDPLYHEIMSAYPKAKFSAQGELARMRFAETDLDATFALMNFFKNL